MSTKCSNTHRCLGRHRDPGGEDEECVLCSGYLRQYVDMSILELMRRELEPLAFQVKNELLQPQRLNSMERESFSFGGLLRSQRDCLTALSPHEE